MALLSTHFISIFTRSCQIHCFLHTVPAIQQSWKFWVSIWQWKDWSSPCFRDWKGENQNFTHPNHHLILFVWFWIREGYFSHQDPIHITTNSNIEKLKFHYREKKCISRGLKWLKGESGSISKACFLTMSKYVPAALGTKHHSFMFAFTFFTMPSFFRHQKDSGR